MFKITSLNSLSVVLKIAIGLISSKIAAVFIGPAGMALMGNLRNFLNSLENISTLGFQNGIVKYTAENKKKEQELQKIIASVFIILILVALIMSVVLYGFASFWDNKIFNTQTDYAIVFKILALAFPWYAVSVFLLAILNGLSKFKKVIWVNIIGNIAALLVIAFLIVQFKTMGALVAAAVSPSLLFFITFYFIQQEIPFLQAVRLKFFDFQIIKKLLPYSVMALFSSVLGPVIFLLIRNKVISVIGIDQAGFWETMLRISSSYMLFVTTLLTVYFLPKLASAQNNEQTKAIFWQYYKFILPVFCAGVVMIYFARFIIIQILFTKAFLPVSGLFFWQLLGDVFKVCSLILGYQFFAKKMTKAFIVTEVLSLLFLYFLSIYLIDFFGIQGVVIAQTIDNLVYLIVLGLYFRKSLF
ncbi:O-antigen translocase [Flavobacterium sp. KB82]|uniref:O-antigen translocase n=1 Tax=Flavobacterium hungaricum TaxID=2082725 RepID=A0ABR9TFI6_9FLAO|nr:O-antigen translocase [Flavobacterium hungaricum]